MIKKDVIDYLNRSTYNREFNEVDVIMIRNFIHLKHGKLLEIDKIRQSMMYRRMDLVNLMHNFYSSLSAYFELTEVYKNNKLIKYHGV